MNTFLQQAWIAAKIWFFAVIANTIIGTLFLSDFFTNTHTIGDFLQIGFLLSGLYSFPVFLILLVVINRCMAAQITGRALFQVILFCGMGLTVIIFLLFCFIKGFNFSDWLILFLVALGSGVIGVCTQYRPIYKTGNTLNSTEYQEL